MTIQRKWHLSQAEDPVAKFLLQVDEDTSGPYVKPQNLAHLVAPPAKEKVSHGVFWLKSKGFVHVLLRGEM